MSPMVLPSHFIDRHLLPSILDREPAQDDCVVPNLDLLGEGLELKDKMTLSVLGAV